MHDKPKFTTHEHNPVIHGTPPLIFHDRHAAQQDRHDTKQAALTASSEAAEREMQYLRALNPPRSASVEPPSLRQPVLPSDFIERVDALHEALFARGIALDRERLVSLGRARFSELLSIDRDVRAFQRVLFTDLTSFSSVEQSLTAVDALRTSVPRVRTAEALRGDGADRTAAASITGFSDLWKAQQEPASVRNVYRFHDAFVSLVFGQSLLERLSNDGRVRSHLFVGGRGRKATLFRDWLGTLNGAHFSVTLADPLAQLFAWLCAEKTPMLDKTDQARDFFNVRAPSQQQARIAEAVFHGFLLGYSSWKLWDFTGRQTRQAINEQLLETRRGELAKRYSAITRFHDELRQFFLRDVGDSSGGYLKFDAHAYHDFIERSMRKLLNRLSQIVALEIDAMHSGAIVAHVDNWLLFEGEANAVSKEKISEKLTAAFRGSTFNITIEEVRP